MDRSNRFLDRERHVHTGLDSPNRYTYSPTRPETASRIEYIPVERKIVQYEDVVRTNMVPVKRTITDYKDNVVYDTVPREVIKQDYYAVEHVRSYKPDIVPEIQTEIQPREVKKKRVQYIPVEKQIIHYPESMVSLEDSKRLLTNEGLKFYDNVQFKPIGSNSRLQTQVPYQSTSYQTDYRPRRSYSPVEHNYNYPADDYYSRSYARERSPSNVRVYGGASGYVYGGTNDYKIYKSGYGSGVSGLYKDSAATGYTGYSGSMYRDYPVYSPSKYSGIY